jgi:ATP-binding cassette subfamily F protein uup
VPARCPAPRSGLHPPHSLHRLHRLHRPHPARAAPAADAPAAPRKLSYKETRELEQWPARLEALEVEQRGIDAQLADPALYAREPQRASALHARHAQIEEELMAGLERWEALAARA